MVIYKKFQVYFVDPTTLETIADMGECIMTFVHQTATMQSVLGHLQLGVQQCENSFNAVFSGEDIRTSIFNYPEWLDRTYGDPEFPGLSFSVWDDLTKFVNVTRLSVYTGSQSSVRMKVVASNGQYALSLDFNPLYPFWYQSFDLYDSNGNYVTQSRVYFCCYYNGTNPELTWYGLTIDGNGNILPGPLFRNIYNVEATGTNNWTRSIGTQTDRVLDGDTAQWLNGIPNTDPDEPEEPEDPYDPAGDTGDDDTPGDGGDGDFDDDTDPIPIPDIPDETDVSASNSRFITLFAPTTGQLNDLANYMWSSSFDLDAFKLLFANPMDCILGLSTIPFTPTTNGSGTVTVGNISTGVTMTKCKQYKEIDCGSINVKKYWGAYLDYAPFTKAEIYLPFIGMRPLSVDDIMGKSVHVVYHIDVLSGACVAYIKCGNSVLYNFVGQCSQSIPVTSNDFTNVVNGALGIAGAIGSMVASGGASAPYAAGTLVSSAINALKPNIERSGGLAGGASMMEIKKPYLVLTRPKQALAKNQSKYMGLPTWITRTLSSVSGYTRVEHVKFGNSHATEEEQKEIIALLKEGVFL